MHLHRNFGIAVMLVAGASIALPYSAIPVEASATSSSASIAKRVFSADSLPMNPYMTARVPATESQAAAPLPEGKGKDLAEKKCTMCHATNIWTSQRHTREQWTAVIDTMLSRGLEASDDELDTITDYLAQNFGPVAKPAPTTAPDAPPTPPPSDAPPSKPPAY